MESKIRQKEIARPKEIIKKVKGKKKERKNNNSNNQKNKKKFS